MAEASDDKRRSSRSLLRDLAHELRDALSPVSASIDLLRVRHFEADTARVVAERVERGLHRAFATLESFALAEQADSGTLTLAVVPARWPISMLQHGICSAARYASGAFSRRTGRAKGS